MSMTSWTEEACDETTLRFASELAEFFAARAGKEAEPFLGAIRTRDYDSLLSLDLPFRGGPGVYHSLAQAVACFKKLPCIKLSGDPKESAIRKFLEGEEKCRQTNQIFGLWKRGEFQFRPAVESILHMTQRKILKILGPVPAPDGVGFRLSPGGASTKTKKRCADLRNLLADIAYCSEELLEDEDFLRRHLATVPHLTEYLKVSQGDVDAISWTIHRSRLDFVRKDAKTDRIITVEPPMNKFLQNGYGDYMRNRLKRQGVDLRDQSVNSELARIGSITGGIATVDLTNASGLMSLALVEHLVPPEWYDLLMTIRSAYTVYGRKLFTMQAYAGMGNGTTFPLETIIFHTLAESVMDYLRVIGPHNTYGDDIVVPTEAVPLLFQVFADLGLEVNKSKSFVDGPFRESCGKDWFSGYLVRPAFLRGNISNERLFILHNFFVRSSDYEAAAFVLKYIPHPFWVFGPDGYGDGHLLGDWSGKQHEHTTRTTVASCKRDHDGPCDSGCYRTKIIRTSTSMFEFETFAHIAKTSWQVRSSDILLPIYTVYRADECDADLGREYPVKGPAVFRFNSSLAERNKYHRRTAKLLAEGRIPLPDQTPQERSRRGWRIMHHEDCAPPDSMAWVKGTPMPGARGYRRLKVCTFERPASVIPVKERRT